MTKAVLTIGYKSYVMDLKEAVNVAEAISRAEMYESKWSRETSESSFHIYPNMKDDFGDIKLISDDLYRMAKLAGKPAASS